MMTTEQTDTTGTPFAELAVPDTGDYTVTCFISIDRQDERRGPDGHFVPDQGPPFYGAFCVEAGRESGVWSLRVSPWSGEFESDNVLTGPPVVYLTDQTDGPDPLALLRALLTGTAP